MGPFKSLPGNSSLLFFFHSIKFGFCFLQLLLFFFNLLQKLLTFFEQPFLLDRKQEGIQYRITINDINS